MNILKKDIKSLLPKGVFLIDLKENKEAKTGSQIGRKSSEPKIN